jgi:hypothetical protein
MIFKIQAGNPRITNEINQEANSIGDAIEASFPLNSEHAVIIWNYVPILLTYKYDVGMIIDDILKMLNRIRCRESGQMSIRWPSNTFACTWCFDWREGNISIRAEWESVIGDTESLLNQNNFIAICSESFFVEWKKVLYNIINALNACGYKKDDLLGFKELIEEFEAISRYGILYE